MCTAEAETGAGGTGLTVWLDLMQWLSPAFPTGAFAYSHGLEQAIAADELRSEAALSDWLDDILRYGAGWNDAVLIGAALSGEALEPLADLARALAGSAERLAETEAQGRAFTLARNEMTGAAEAALPLPLAFARAALRIGAPAEPAIALFLHAFASNLVSCAVRFMPLGQAAGQRVLAGLHPRIAELASRAARAGTGALATSAFRADLGAMAHETMEVRIFRT